MEQPCPFWAVPLGQAGTGRTRNGAVHPAAGHPAKEPVLCQGVKRLLDQMADKQ